MITLDDLDDLMLIRDSLENLPTTERSQRDRLIEIFDAEIARRIMNAMREFRNDLK